jgi:hypothetical protein
MPRAGRARVRSLSLQVLTIFQRRGAKAAAHLNTGFSCTRLEPLTHSLKRLYDSLWTAVMPTSATSWGWEIMTTCEAPSTSVTVAPMRS